mmetsp:Transcript_9955/g.32864  ORF Transcript_9955/g.32864 Transcript_9955/m.32864 type:complete len:85 (+) Transcript_9955:37-291(+)
MQLVQCLAFVSTAAALAPVRQLAKPLLQAAAPVAAFAAAPAFAEGLETTLQVANNLADTDVFAALATSLVVGILAIRLAGSLYN